MGIMVFCLKEQFVQADTNIFSFHIGTLLGLSSAAYSNISTNKLGGFPCQLKAAQERSLIGERPTVLLHFKDLNLSISNPSRVTFRDI